MGYGMAHRDGVNIRAHQAAWIDAGRELVAGMQLHHVCEEKLCVNVDHLVLITASDHARLHRPPREECLVCGSTNLRQHTRYGRADGWRCRPCMARKQRARNRRKALA